MNRYIHIDKNDEKNDLKNQNLTKKIISPIKKIIPAIKKDLQKTTKRSLHITSINNNYIYYP